MVFHLDVQFPVFSRQLVTKETREPYIGEGRNKKQIGSSKTEVIDPKKKSIVNFPRSFPRRTRHLLVLVNTCFTCWPECRALWMMLIADTMTLSELNFLCSWFFQVKKMTNIPSKQRISWSCVRFCKHANNATSVWYFVIWRRGRTLKYEAFDCETSWPTKKRIERTSLNEK